MSPQPVAQTETREEAVAQMTPPPEMNFVGAGDFIGIGNTFLKQFKKLGGLKPHHHVLDVGSGIGRMAIPLTSFLDAQGSYDGFDIREDGVTWCQEKITPRYPNFKFKLATLGNSHYLPEATGEAGKFHFPYPSRTFDLVVLTSVFTHVDAEVVCNYLEEINRVLKRGGRMFATFFLFAHGAPERPDRPAAQVHFPHQFGHYRLMSLENPAHAIAFDESWVTAQCERRGLQVRWPIHHGFQDVLVAEKKRQLPLKTRWRRFRHRLTNRR